ncbi:MAG: hypothetical protein ABL989_07715 [Gammaproteobacteria bacterium]
MNDEDNAIDLDFRPRSYFWPLGLEKHLLSRVKGAQRKQALKALLDAGRLDDVPDFLAKAALSGEERRAIGRIHPMLMGGEYLPDTNEQEVEIARISIHSVTSDVTSVYARRGPEGIAYRVVDEYEGGTLTNASERSSKVPLSLVELANFFVGAWPLMDVLERNYEGDLDSMLGFFWADSAFYPQFDALLRQRAVETFGSTEEDSHDAQMG